MNALNATLIAVTLIAVPAVASAKTPFKVRKTQSHSVELEQAGETYAVERLRTPGRKVVRFFADAEPIAPDAVMVFEVTTEDTMGISTTRWRCVALDDVAECLGGEGVRIGWRTFDDAAKLTVRVEPTSTREGLALVREALNLFPVVARR